MTRAKHILLLVCMVVDFIIASAQNAEKIIIITDKQTYYPGEQLQFTLQVYDVCNDTLSQMSKIAYVELIGEDSRPVHQMMVAIADAYGIGSFTMGESLLTGNYTVVAYTSWMKNAGVNMFARQTVQVINPLKMASLGLNGNEEPSSAMKTSTATIDLPKKTFGKRERIPVSFNTAGSGSVTVSVFKIDALQRRSNVLTDQQQPDPCMYGTGAVNPFTLEDRGHIITARVVDKRSQQPAPGIRAYLSIANNHNDLFVATSDSAGTVRFEVDHLSGKRELVFQTNSNVDSNYTIELVTPFAGKAVSSKNNLGKANVFETMPAVINEAMVSAQVQRYYHSGSSNINDTITGSPFPFYGKPDAFYLVSDYVYFSTVEEILREYVTTVGVQKRNGRPYPIIYNMLTDRIPFAEPPLILVNGIPVFDYGQFMNMNTDEFHSIAVVGKKYFMGHQVFHGIIDLRLKKAFKDYGRHATAVDYNGVSETGALYSPVYENEQQRNSRKPDFRNVLYWNPRLRKGANGDYSFTFYSSDLAGEYAIVIRSASNTGEVDTHQTLIQVK